MPILQVNNLTKIFSAGFWPFQSQQIYTVVNNLSFSLNRGEILGFLGPNGAGKTTTIQMLLGTLTPTTGSITYFGHDFFDNRIATLKKIGYASGYDKLPARLTLIDNLDIIGRMYNIPEPDRAQQIEKLLKFFGIWKIAHQQTGALSAGQSTRLMLAKAFIANPEIILLDEPTASLDPNVAHEVRQFILAQRKERNVSILITSHNMDEVAELCDRVLVLKEGTLIANNTPEQLAQTIAKVRINLTVTHNLQVLNNLLETLSWIYTIQDNTVTVEIDEQNIALFIVQLAEQKIIYSQISIDKPTLEDYFFSIAR